MAVPKVAPPVQTHAKYERLIARAKEVPSVKTVVGDLAARRCRGGGGWPHRSHSGGAGCEDHRGGEPAQSRHRRLRAGRCAPQRKKARARC
jgi:hypothetical protein